MTDCRYNMSEKAGGMLRAATQIASAGIAPAGGCNRKKTTLRILLAARDGSLEGSLAHDLERTGHTVTQASSPLEAAAAIGHRRPDLLITDLSFCTYAGKSILSVCRSTCPECRVVLATSWARELVEICRESYDVDWVISSACRTEEVREVLQEIADSAGRTEHES